MHRRPSRARACTLLAAVALAASACSSSDADKAGGTRTKPPVVLTLADHEQGPDQVQYWIEEVQRRSGGSLRIQVTNHWRDQEVAYNKGTISDVQAGMVALAKVAARAYDTVGIDSFQALVAPLLIDNPTLERRALESDLATKMLAGTDELGLVGVDRPAQAAGRHAPAGAGQGLPGGRMGVGEGEVAKATVTALGATSVSTLLSGPLRGLDGLDLDLGEIKVNGYDQQATALTANVTLWFTYTSGVEAAAPSPCAGACIGMCSPSSGTPPSVGRRRRTWSSRGAGPAERELGQEVRPPPGGLWTLQPPLQRLDPVGQAAQTRATPRVCAANTVVADLDGHQACPTLDPDLNPHQLPTAATALRHELADSPNRNAARPQPTFHGVEPVKRSLAAVCRGVLPAADAAT